MYKQITSLGSVLFCSVALAFVSTNSYSSRAVQAPDGTVSFESGILLVNAYTTFNSVRVRQARYYFNLELPEGIGEPLKKVVFQQRTGTDEIEFKPEKTRAFLGDHRNKQEELESITTINQETGEVTVEFTEAIAQGNRVTIGIKPKENPDLGGVYLFGVTAFPEGEKPRGLYLGSGRLQFFDSFNSSG